MTKFSADFTTYPTDVNLLHPPVQIEFTNKTVLGTAYKDDFTYAVDENDTPVTPAAELNTYIISEMAKIAWNFGDELVSNSFNEIHKYEFAGQYNVSLSVYSQKITDSNGLVFRIKTTKTITLTLGSMVFNWLKNHMTAPHQEALETSESFKDLISSSSKMFDRMFKEITEVSSLMDIKKVAPKFLEYFSDTLNHKRFYSRKIGYANQEENENKDLFLDYDIFNRIEKNIATEPELELFRQFIIDTAAIFKQNGSKECLEKFFKLYNFVISLKEMWTETFGQTSPALIVDDFLFLNSLISSKNTLNYQNISVAGWENSAALSYGYNFIALDGYHYTTQFVYPNDSITVSPDKCSHSFLINGSNIKGVLKGGSTISRKTNCEGYDYLTNVNEATISNNSTWVGSSKITPNSISYKIWQAPAGYVEDLQNVMGVLPNNLDEIDEYGSFGDTNDDYLWASWKTGVTIPNNLVGYSQINLRKPTAEIQLPNINWSTDYNQNLITDVKTQTDFFLAGRGFINVTQPGYYVFYIETANDASDTNIKEKQIALLSLKHSTPYNLADINYLQSLDDITFKRDNSTETITIGTTATGTINIYSKKGEYGIVEVRQNEKEQSSGHYYLEPGYYAFEIKATYGALANKTLKLLWEAFQIFELEDVVKFENIIAKTIIPTEKLLTLTARNLAIQDSIGKSSIEIPSSSVDAGEIVTIVYTSSNGKNDAVSGIMSSKKKYKNLEIVSGFEMDIVSDYEENNETAPQHTIIIPFRGTNVKADLYADVDAYYCAIFNGKYGTISIAKAIYSPERQNVVLQKLNLNKNLTEKDAQIYEQQLLTDTGHNFYIETGKYYDIKVSVNNDSVSVYLRQNAELTDVLAGNLQNINDVTQLKLNLEYTPLIENISLLQKDADIIATDWLGNKLEVAIPYKPLLDAGTYGFAVMSSSIKLFTFSVNSLDLVDESLVDTTTKWKTIKPHFLDSRDTTLLKFNSKGLKTIEGKIEPTYTNILTESFELSASVLELKNEEDYNTTSINNIYSNNVDVSTLGTRYNVVFDNNWVQRNFKTSEELKDSIVLPYGNFNEPYINWSNVDSISGAYTTDKISKYNQIISKNNFKVLPHTVAISGLSVLPLTTLDNDGNTLTLIQSPLKTILDSSPSLVVFGGIWEEVCPLSTSEMWSVKIANEVFEPIYRDKTTQTEIIGLKFLNDSAIEKVACRFCTGAEIWGLFEIRIPSYASGTESLDISGMKYFMPIGKVSKDILFLLPAVELLKNESVKVNLLGAYIHKDMDTIGLLSTTKYTLTTKNTWEQKYKSIVKCRYFLDVDVKLCGSVSDYNIYPITTRFDPSYVVKPYSTENMVSNAYVMSKEITTLMTHVKETSTDAENDYLWWSPTNVWLDRSFTINYPENDNSTIFTGLNYPNTIYGQEIDTKQGINILLNALQNNEGQYWVNAEWCVSTVGWEPKYTEQANNEYGFSIFNDGVYDKIGFAADSASRMKFETITPIGVNIGLSIPVESVSISSQTTITLGLINDSGSAKTLNPYGLLNWFDAHTKDISGEPFQWEITERNDQYTKGMVVKNIFQKIETTNYVINDYWAYYTNNIPNFGAVTSIKIADRTCSSYLENEPNQKMLMGVSDTTNMFYFVPPIYTYIPKWDTCVSQVINDSVVLNKASYYSAKLETDKYVNVIFNVQSSAEDLTKYVGTQLVAELVTHNDTTQSNTKIEALTDNMAFKREISWIPYLESEDNLYRIPTRKIDTVSKYVTDNPPYILDVYNGENVMKLAEKFDTEYKVFAGTDKTNTVVGPENNTGIKNVMYVLDNAANEYTLSVDFIFDKKIIEEDYTKRFDLVLKAKSLFTKDFNWGISDHYFVGVGVYGFDIGLGTRHYDKTTGLVTESYLASWGEYNTRNIKIDTWYTLTAKVEADTIKIYFSEKGEARQLVLNYNISKKYEEQTERYLVGQYETLEAIVSGLQNLMITYPNKLSNTVSAKFTYENFKEDLVKNIIDDGFYTGIKLYNQLTYVSNVTYTQTTPVEYKWGSTLKVSSLDQIIKEIEKFYTLPADPDIKKVQKTLNFTTYVLLNETLYYKKMDNFVEKYPRPVADFYTVENKVFIVEKEPLTDSGIGLNVWDVGNHDITWSVSNNVYNIENSQDFFETVTNLQKVVVTRDSKIISEAGTTITSGTSATTGTPITGNNVALIIGDIITLTIGYGSITWPFDGQLERYNLMARVWEEGFSQEYTIMIKDKTFYNDEIKSYMQFSNKKLNKVHINDNRMHLIFEDL